MWKICTWQQYLAVILRRCALRDAAWLADRGYDPVYGARPLKRVIQRELQNPLAQQILEGRIPDGSVVHVTASPLGLVIGEITPAMAAQ